MMTRKYFFLESIMKFSKKVKSEFKLYSRLSKDDRTPLVSKLLLIIALSYLVMPFDLIPDWIPVLGQLDDLVIVPLLIWLAILFIPTYLMNEYRKIYSI